jgi:phosphate-selective porin OprO/OprP
VRNCPERHCKGPYKKELIGLSGYLALLVFGLLPQVCLAQQTSAEPPVYFAPIPSLEGDLSGSRAKRNEQSSNSQNPLSDILPDSVFGQADLGDQLEATPRELTASNLLLPQVPLLFQFGQPDDYIKEGERIAKDEKGGYKPTSNFTMELQIDFGWFGQDTVNEQTVGPIPDGAFFRRARVGWFGELYEKIEYRTEFDFAEPARPRFLDNWVALRNLPIIRNAILGHYFEPFSLERYTPNRFITFTERSLADTFAPVRNMGAMVYGNVLDERVAWAAGVFRSNSNDYGEDVSFRGGYAGTFHTTFLPWYEEIDEYTRRLLHLGGSVSYRTPGDDPVRFSTRPSARMRQQGVGGIPVFVDTGDIDDVDYFWLYGIEAAWVEGPFSVQAEVIQSTVIRHFDENPTFRGGYIYGSWFLTGESRSYSPTSILGRFREGIFQRMKPRSAVFQPTQGGGVTGIGAWEIAARWSFIDLNDAGIEGGYLYDLTYGLTWYLNEYTKSMFNYVQANLKDPVQGSSTANLFVWRVQFEF